MNVDSGSLTILGDSQFSGGHNTGDLTLNKALTLDGKLTNTGSLTLEDKLNFEGSGSLMQSAGTLTTGYDNVFTASGDGQTQLNVIGLSAKVPETVRKELTDLFTYYIKGDVAQELADNATFTGGKVVVSGVSLTETQRDDLTQAFKEKLFSPDCSIDSNVLPAALA